MQPDAGPQAFRLWVRRADGNDLIQHTVHVGTVISESPAAGTQVNGSSAIALVVSSGVAVPNLVGSAQASARAGTPWAAKMRQ